MWRSGVEWWEILLSHTYCTSLWCIDQNHPFRVRRYTQTNGPVTVYPVGVRTTVGLWYRVTLFPFLISEDGDGGGGRRGKIRRKRTIFLYIPTECRYESRIEDKKKQKRNAEEPANGPKIILGLEGGGRAQIIPIESEPHQPPISLEIRR